VSGFWPAPRGLARLLTEGQLTLTAFALLHYLAEIGADRPEGTMTSNGALADALRCHKKTVRRALARLRELGLLDFADHAGRAPFCVRTRVDWKTFGESPGTAPGAPESEVVSQATWDTPVAATERDPVPAAASRRVATWDSSRARAKTETENTTELTLSGPPALDTTARTPAQALVAYYVDLLRANGLPIPSRQVGHVARQVGELFDDGVPPETIARALDLMHERRLNPATLPSLITEAAAGPGSREHPADRMLRELRNGDDRW
jgi:hypothetical protein